MRIIKQARFAALPLAASLLLGGCILTTSENENATADSKQISAFAASTTIPWSLKDGLAKEIAVGPDNSVFMLGLTPVSNGSHRLYRWTGTNWIATQGTGFQLDVGEGGVPYLLGSDNKVYKGDPTGSNWIALNGIMASEIAVGPNGTV